MKNILTIAGLLIKESFRKKDFYATLILSGMLLAYASRIEFYEVGSIYRYLLEIGLALAFGFTVVLTVILAARQFPSEVQNRTLPVLLSKPVTRWEYVAGKFLGSVFGGLLSFAVFFAVVMFFALTKSHALSFLVGVQTVYLFALVLLMVTAMASALSYVFTFGASALFTLLAYFGMLAYGPLLAVSAEKSGALRPVSMTVFNLLPHFEFFDLRARFIHGWPGLSPAALAFVTLYALCYTAFFLLLGWQLFRKKNLT